VHEAVAVNKVPEVASSGMAVAAPVTIWPAVGSVGLGIVVVESWVVVVVEAWVVVVVVESRVVVVVEAWVVVVVVES